METPCHEWTGARNGNYGMMSFENQPSALTHRIIYIITKGPIPDNMTINHDCENPICCNPEHLRMLTQSENIRSSTIKGARAKKLDIPKVKAIKVLLAEGTLSQYQIASVYGVSQTAIRQIKTGKNWGHV